MSTTPENALSSEALVTNNNSVLSSEAIILANTTPVEELDNDLIATTAAMDTNAGTAPEGDFWSTYAATAAKMSNNYDPFTWVRGKAEMQAPVTASKRLTQGARNVERGIETPDAVAEDLRDLGLGSEDIFIRATQITNEERALAQSPEFLAENDLTIDAATNTYFNRKLQKKFKINPETGSYEGGVFGSLSLAWQVGTAVLVPFRTTESIAALNDLLKSNTGTRPLLGVEAIDGWGAYRKMYDAWWKLPAKKRFLLANDIDAVMEALSYGNALLYASLVAPFQDEDALKWLKLDMATDVLSYIPGARGFLLDKIDSLRKARKASKAMDGYNALSAKQRATAFVVNLTHPEKARVVGVNPNEVIETSVPILNNIATPTFVGPPRPFVGPIAPVPETLRALDADLTARGDQMAALANRIDWRTQGYVKDSIARTVAQKALEGLKNTYPRILKADIEDVDGKGFTISVTRADDTPLGMTADKVADELAMIESELGSVEARAELLRFRTQTPGQLSGIEDVWALKNELKLTEKRFDDLISRREQLWKEEVDIRVSTKTPIVEKKRFAFGIDEQGVFEARTARGNWWMSSNDVIFRDVDKSIVGEATRLDFYNTAQRETITRMWREANRGLSYLQRRLLNTTELAGDKVAKLFTVGELKTMGLKGPAIEAYYLRRSLYDKFHFLENKKLFRELEFDGYKYSRLLGISDGKKAYKEVFLRPFKDDGGWLPRGVTRVYDPDKRAIVDVDRKIISKKLEDGYQVFRFRKPVDTGTEMVDYAIMKADRHVGELPNQVLGYRRGYVPLIRKDAHWIVNEIKPYKRNGELVHVGKTVRVFDNAYDAKLYASTMTPKNTSATYRAEEAGRVDAEGVSKVADIHISGQGGLFDAERSEEVVYKGFLNEEAERVNATDAFEAYLDHISIRYPLNEFRLHLVSKYLNTFSDNLTDPNDWMSALQDSTKGTARNAETVRNKIRSILYLRTNEERWFNEKLGQIANSLGADKSYKNLAKYVKGFQEVDIVGAIRSSTFYAFLGFYNPSQIVVQALGGTIALAVDPKWGAVGYLRYMALRPAFYAVGSDSDSVFRTIWANTAGRAAGLNPEEYEHAVKLFRKSGIHESVRGTHADFASATNGNVISPTALRLAADQSLFYWREGELSLRGGAYFIAQARKASTLKRGILDLTEEMNDEIVKDSVRMTMNLNRANAAEINKGIPGISTQFWQIMMKFYENTMPNFMPGTARNFTAGEKARIWIFTTAAFGASGIPAGEWGLNEFYSFLKRRRAEGSAAAATIFDALHLDDREWARIYRSGMAEKVMRDAFEIDVNLTGRASIPIGYQEKLKDLLATDYSIWELLSGASGTFGITMGRQISEVGKILGIGNPEIELTPEVALQGIFEASKIISSVNNATRAHFMWEQQKLVAYKQGKPDAKLYSRDIDPSKDFMSIVGQAAGFPIREVQDAIEQNIFADKYTKEIITGYLEAWKKHWYSWPAGGFSSQAALDAYTARGMALIPEDEDIRAKIVAAIAADEDAVYDAFKRQSALADLHPADVPYSSQIGGPLSGIGVALNPESKPEEPKE